MTEALLPRLSERLGEKILGAEAFRGEETIVIARENVREIFRLLKEEPEFAFNFLMDLTAVDYWRRRTPRFDVVYHLYSLEHNRRLRVKVPLPEEDPVVDSLTPLWKGANWLERETWDMYGIRFRGHPDLRRILLYEAFQGHPLRKDYPVNDCQPLVRLREVQGTFVDERSANKLAQLRHRLKPQDGAS